MKARIGKAKAAILMFLVIPQVLAFASPFDVLPTPRVPGFGGFMPILDGLTKLQLSLNAALGKGLFAYADGFNLQVFLSTSSSRLQAA